MKQFCCGDIVPGCTAEFSGADEKEIFRKITVHAHQSHALVEIPETLVAQIRQLIREVPAA